MKNWFFVILLLSLFAFACGDNNTINIPVESSGTDSQFLDAINSEGKTVNYNPQSWILIDTLPYTISGSGSFKIKKSLQGGANENGILITGTSNVTLNLNGLTISSIGSTGINTGIKIRNSSYVLINNGNIKGFRVAIEFDTSSFCTAKNLTVSGGLLNQPQVYDAPPPYYSGCKVINSNNTQISWSDWRGLDYGLEVTGNMSYSNKYLSNSVYGGWYARIGFSGIFYDSPLSSPHNDLVKNNLITKFRTGIIANTVSGHNKFNGNTIGYYDNNYSNTDSTNEFFNNMYRQLASP
jgi:hypothetical protein